ncbi:hypothetical protein EON73_01990 [bacterium]|nr:MAG: hypothetical protein EON73_01990 [bacterium]
MKKNLLMLLAILLVITGIIMIIGFLNYLSKDYTFGGDNIDITKTGAVGDYIGGFVGTIFALAGFVFVYLTYIDQRESNEKEKIENRFFTLIQIHTNNVNNTNYHNPYNV